MTNNFGTAPIELVETMLENVEATLARWLQANHAPQEVISAAWNINGLRAYLELARSNYDQKEWQMQQYGIRDTLAEVAESIAAMGGIFRGADSQTMRRVPISWEYPEPEKVFDERPVVAEALDLANRLRKVVRMKSSPEVQAMLDAILTLDTLVEGVAPRRHEFDDDTIAEEIGKAEELVK